MEELIEWLLWHERVNKEMLSSDEELEGRRIHEDMRMKYRANRRKWGVRLWR